MKKPDEGNYLRPAFLFFPPELLFGNNADQNSADHAAVCVQCGLCVVIFAGYQRNPAIFFMLENIGNSGRQNLAVLLHLIDKNLLIGMNINLVTCLHAFDI